MKTPMVEHTEHRKGWLAWAGAITAGATFAASYLRTFVLPHTPILFWGDQILYATNGMRLLSGQSPYSGYFEFLTPGTDLVYALLFRSFGIWLWIPNLLMDILAAAAVLLTTKSSAKVLRHSSVLLPAIFALGFGFYGSMDATHHWISTVIGLAAMLTLLHGTKSRHVALAGALCGLMASFTQSKGVTVTLGFLVYVVWSSRPKTDSAALSWRRGLLLCGSALTSFLLINGTYMVRLGLVEWCRWIIIFPIRYYPTMPGQTLRSPIDDFENHAGLLKWFCGPFLYVAIPLTYVAFLLIFRRQRHAEPDEPWDKLLLITITGVAMFAAVSLNLSIMRASTVCLPALIVLTWLLGRALRGVIWWKTAAAALSLAFAVYMGLSVQRMHWNYLDLPAGRAAILEPGKYDLYRWMTVHTHPGQAFLGIAPLSLPLRLRCPSPIQAPGPWEYYRPEHITRSVAALEANQIPLIVLRPYENFQKTPGFERDNITPFQEYVDQHYRRIKNFSTGDEAWVRIVKKRTIEP